MKIEFTVPGNPIPWRRARRKGERYFIHPKVAEYQEEIIVAFLEEWREIWPTLSEAIELPCWKEESVGLELKFYRGDRRRVDLDNLEKVVMDALGGYQKRPGYLWQDDSQIKEKHSYLFYDRENPRVEIEAWELDG